MDDGGAGVLDGPLCARYFFDKRRGVEDAAPYE